MQNREDLGVNHTCLSLEWFMEVKLLLWTSLEGTGVEGIQIFPFNAHLDFRIIISELPIRILLIISLNKDKSLSPILRCNYNILLIFTKSTNRILFNTWPLGSKPNQRLSEVKIFSSAHYNTK